MTENSTTLEALYWILWITVCKAGLEWPNPPRISILSSSFMPNFNKFLACTPKNEFNHACGMSFLKNHREWKLKNLSRHLMQIRIDMKIIEGEEMTSLFRNIKRINIISWKYEIHTLTSLISAQLLITCR